MRCLGFTLLELLVVIAVIAILIAVFAPALNKSKESAKELVCQNNLRQLNQALYTYTDTYQSYPYGFNDASLTAPHGDYPGDSTMDYQAWWWFHYITEEKFFSQTSQSRELLWCPSRKVLNSMLTSNILCGNYGINASISKIFSDDQPTEFEGTPVKINQIRSPSSTMILMDSGYALISWKALVADTATYTFELPRLDSFFLPGHPVNKERPINPDQEIDAFDGRHSGKRVNVVYIDGHIKSVESEKFIVEANTERKVGWSPNP